jgi:adenosine kinase
MGRADQLSFHAFDPASIDLAIISPNAPAAMVKYVSECQELDIPYIYDPSQQIIRLSAEELREGARGARVLIVNEYELGMIRNKTGLTEGELLSPGRALRSSRVVKPARRSMPRGRSLTVPAVPPRVMVEPTGVGDAYRAGVIKGMLRDYPGRSPAGLRP